VFTGFTDSFLYTFIVLWEVRDDETRDCKFVGKSVFMGQSEKQ
jgi:hypothetical protein